METKNIILIAIVVLIIALACLGAYIFTHNNQNLSTTSNTTQNITNTTLINNTNSTPIMVNDTVKINQSSDNKNNTTYRIYDPQTDGYVTVIGESYDSEVDRWYTYDSDGVRYYNTRIKN